MSAPNLPSLPSVKQISKYVTRILGQNPGKFTLQGTNTYLIHHPTSPSLILLDTAQNVPSYLPHLREALLSHPIQPCYVSDIILSHWHLDHVDGLRSILEELGEIGAAGKEGRRTKVWKYRCEGDDEVGKDQGIEGMLEGLKEGLVEIEESGERLVEGGNIRALKEGQRFTIDGEGDKVEIEVISSPGHTTDSISLLLRSSSSSSSSPLGLFSFDTVLGHGTAVFSSLSTYLNSLSSLISRLPEEEKVPIYPGHGELIEDGVGKLKEYRKHRLEREEQVVEALKGMKEREGGVTASELTESIYGSTIPASLIPAATRGLLLHLEKLVLDNRVSRQPPPKGTGEKVDWSSMGIEEKDVPKGWGDVWSLRGEAN